jgi:hypothetical protein
MVAGRLGQTLVPGLALDAGILEGSGLMSRPLIGGASRTVALVWRSGSPRAEEFRLLGRALAAFSAGKTLQDQDFHAPRRPAMVGGEGAAA